MGHMRTINKADWTPTPLVSPKGRLYTPSSYVEHKQLVASGYVPAPEPVPAELEPAPAPTAPPAAEPIAASAPEPITESSEKSTDDEPAEAPKTKSTTRRTTGGAQ